MKAIINVIGISLSLTNNVLLSKKSTAYALLHVFSGMKRRLVSRTALGQNTKCGANLVLKIKYKKLVFDDTRMMHDNSTLFANWVGGRSTFKRGAPIGGKSGEETASAAFCE